MVRGGYGRLASLPIVYVADSKVSLLTSIIVILPTVKSSP